MKQTTSLPPQLDRSSRQQIGQAEDSVRGSWAEWPDVAPLNQPVQIPAQQPIDRRVQSLLAAFGYAFAGLWYLVRTQRNAQIHLLIAACALVLGAALGIERWEWLALVLTIALVLAAEGMNTAIEAVVDLVTNSYHPQARIAKDVAAGAVLLCAIAAVVMGCIIFVPHMWPLLIWVFGGLL